MTPPSPPCRAAHLLKLYISHAASDCTTTIASPLQCSQLAHGHGQASACTDEYSKAEAIGTHGRHWHVTWRKKNSHQAAWLTALIRLLGGWTLSSRISSIRGTFLRKSAEVWGKFNINASLVVLSKCRNQSKGGGQKRRRNKPSNPPAMKDGWRNDGGAPAPGNLRRGRA
jgi:hypothetical protein